MKPTEKDREEARTLVANWFSFGKFTVGAALASRLTEDIASALAARQGEGGTLLGHCERHGTVEMSHRCNVFDGEGAQPSDRPPCPITRRPWFLDMEHPELGEVPTYGAPFDSYTVPEVDDDGDLRCERYDHDAGDWVESGESLGLYLTTAQPCNHDLPVFLNKHGRPEVACDHLPASVDAEAAAREIVYGHEFMNVPAVAEIIRKHCGGEEVKRLRNIAEELMRVCFGEANRLANHVTFHPDSAAQWSEGNLRTAANKARSDLESLPLLDRGEK